MADTQKKVNGSGDGTVVPKKEEVSIKSEEAESTDVTPNSEVKAKPEMEVKEDLEKEVKEETKMEIKEESPMKTEDSESTESDQKASYDGEPSPVERKIIRQMEYYFGDFNLGRDRFLQEQFKLDDGWILMETMLKFRRLESLSKDAIVICDALRKAQGALIEVSEDNKKVRRSPSMPLPENTTERKAEVKARSIYAKGFPLDSTMDQLEEFFRTFGEVENIQMRRQIKKKFKGSVFVIFIKMEDAEKFVKTVDLMYKDSVLAKSMKDDYFKRKDEERQQQKLEKEKERKSTREETEKDKAEKESQDLQDRITKGSILHLTGFDGKTSIDDVKNFFNDYSHVQWVDFEKENKEAFVRFSEANQAGVVLGKVKEANDGKVELDGSQLEGLVLEGEAELERWKKIFAAQAESWKRKKTGRSNQQQGRKRGYKKHGHSRDRNSGGREKADGEPPAKAIKTE